MYARYCTGINRNILECKGYLLDVTGLSDTSINRNILECKVRPKFVESKRITSINRNILECKDDSNTNERVQKSNSINRNILECKELPGSQTLRQENVLIETYWNVKARS